LNHEPRQHQLPGYRPEIDGLRALAVGPVVLFHAGIGGWSGGFVGVDVFFVISGFLITAILAREIRAGTFSTLQFYERRIRRIFPALLCMFALCWAVAFGLLMPPDFKAFARSMVASSLFSSNILFWVEGGYFDTAAELKPLLHTWSLSVEEQFYILFPGLLLFLLTKVRHWRLALGVVFSISLLACVLVTPSMPAAAFYLPMFRMWELLCGAFVALSIGFAPIAHPRLRSMAAIVGVACICWATFAFDRATVFPGWSALFPCVGAALVIAYAERTAVGAVLGARPLVWIGKLSYSLYLWHWPIIVLTRYYLMRELEQGEKIAVVGASVAVAYLSLRWVETPFRTGRVAASRAMLIGSAAIGVMCFMGAGVATYLFNGLPQRFPEQVRQLAQGANDTNPQRRLCDNRPASMIARGGACLIGAPDAPTTFAVLGDSFGDALVPGIASAAASAGKRGIVLTSSGCYPLDGLIDMNKRGDETCEAFVTASLELIRRSASITDVVVVGRWTSAALGTRFGASKGADWFITDVQSHGSSYQENRLVFVRSLRRTIDHLKGKRIHIVSYVPEQRIDPPRTLAMCTYLGRACPSGVSLVDYQARQAFVRGVFDRLQEDGEVEVLDVGPRFCSTSGCKVVEGGAMLYSDDNHLSRAGALFIQDMFMPVFRVTANPGGIYR